MCSDDTSLATMSIYFFDPNGVYLELTTTKTSAELGALSAQARDQVERCMTRKRAAGGAPADPRPSASGF